MADDDSPPLPDDQSPDDDSGDSQSGDSPFSGGAGGFNPFAAMPMFNELAKHLQGQGPLNWDAARQFAVLTASGGTTEPNVDPSERMKLIELANIVGPHVNDVGGFDVVFPSPQTVTRSQWAANTLTAYRPLFTELATSLGSTEGDDADDPMSQMLASLNQMMGPGMMGMAVGSMVGTLSLKAFGLHDLPIPRDDDHVELIPANITEFATEFNLAADEVRLWVLAHELAGYALFTIDPVREGISSLVRQHVGAFRPDPNALGDQLAGLETGADPMASIQQALSDPTLLLGAVTSDDQKALEPALNAATAMVIGAIDWIVDGVAVRLIGGDALGIASAARERRGHAANDDAVVEKLLGIRCEVDDVTRGKIFVQGVVDRVGEDGFVDLLRHKGSLPTPNEIDAPGLWIERVKFNEMDQPSGDVD